MSRRFDTQSLEGVTFSVALRGYDRDEVDAYISQVSEAIRGLEGALEKSYLSLGEEMGALLQHAKDSADAMIAKGEAEAEATRDAADAAAKKIREEAEAESRSVRAAAEEHGRATRSDADNYAQKTRSSADHDASTRIADADNRVGQLRQEESEIRSNLLLLATDLEAVARRTSDLASEEESKVVLATRPEARVEELSS